MLFVFLSINSYLLTPLRLQYQPTDQVLKLNNCSHWLHKDCLQVSISLLFSKLDYEKVICFFSLPL